MHRRTAVAHPEPCCLHPLGAPTHLPLSCPFCWSRTYRQRSLQEVTSQDEIIFSCQIYPATSRKGSIGGCGYSHICLGWQKAVSRPTTKIRVHSSALCRCWTSLQYQVWNLSFFIGLFTETSMGCSLSVKFAWRWFASCHAGTLHIVQQ